MHIVPSIEVAVDEEILVEVFLYGPLAEPLEYDARPFRQRAHSAPKYDGAPPNHEAFAAPRARTLIAIEGGRLLYAGQGLANRLSRIDSWA